MRATSTIVAAIVLAGSLSGCREKAPDQQPIAPDYASHFDPSTPPFRSVVQTRSLAAPASPAAAATEPIAFVTTRAEMSKPAGPSVSPHAMKLIRLGDNLRTAGKAIQAIDFYRDAVKKHPGTVQAGEARVRILALGGMVPAPSEYSPMDEPKPDPPKVRKRIPEPSPPRAPAAPPVEASVGTSSGSSYLHTGPRGGVYHYSKSGKKVYQRK